MKKQRSAIWEKKRQRKFKNTKPTKSISSSANKLQPAMKVVPQKKENTSPKTPKISFLKHLTIRKKKSKEEKNHSKNSNQFLLWLRKNDSDLQLILFPLILLIILIILYFVNSQVFLPPAEQEPILNNQTTQLNPYPYVQAANAPSITAKAGIILDRGSQVILFEKNSQLRFSMASTTKIMTALIALNYYKPDDILTIKRSYVAGSGLNFYLGEKFRFIDLMYAMMLPSANDAAQAIADNYPGGSDAFVKQMNAKAQSLHLSNTHYSDPVGLDDDGDYSTVIDMARLSSYAISNPTFVEITSTKYKTIYTSDFSRSYPLTNLNQLLGIDGVTGIKTGTTEGAGEVLVTSMIRNGHTYIIVVMDSLDRFGDTTALLNFIDSNVKYVVPPPPGN